MVKKKEEIPIKSVKKAVKETNKVKINSNQDFNYFDEQKILEKLFIELIDKFIEFLLQAKIILKKY